MAVSFVFFIFLLGITRATAPCMAPWTAQQEAWVTAYAPPYFQENPCPIGSCRIEFRRLSSGFSSADFQFRVGLYTGNNYVSEASWSFQWSSGGWSSTQSRPSVTASYASFTISLTLSNPVRPPISCSAVLNNIGGLYFTCPSGSIYTLPTSCGCNNPSSDAGKYCLRANNDVLSESTFVCSNNQIYCGST